MAELRHGLVSDYDVLMERVAASFREGNPSHARFEDLYPDSISRTAGCMYQWLLMLEDDEIVAGLQIVPRQMIVAGCEMSAAGIGNVFCYPTCRGRGYMSQLLEEAICTMGAEGQAVAMLGGDRTRYGHFGWEHAGSSRRLILSKQVTRHCSAVCSSGLGLREWRKNGDDTKRMFDAYCGHPYRLTIGAETFSLALSRPGQVVWICDSDSEGFAYACVRGRTILEYAGSGAGLARILMFLLNSGEHSVVIPPCTAQTELECMLLGSASSYTVVPTGMINVLSLERVLRAYLTLLEARLAGWCGRFSVVDVEKGEGVSIERGKSGLKLTGTTRPDPSDAAVLRLSTRELAPLCFGPFPIGLGKWSEHPVVRRLFPLPIHWHALAHV